MNFYIYSWENYYFLKLTIKFSIWIKYVVNKSRIVVLLLCLHVNLGPGLNKNIKIIFQKDAKNLDFNFLNKQNGFLFVPMPNIFIFNQN